MTKIGLKNNLYPQSYFTEHLMGVFGKPPRKSNLDNETSSFSIPAAQEKDRDLPATIRTTVQTESKNIQAETAALGTGWSNTGGKEIGQEQRHLGTLLYSEAAA
jgi:hypothetical protein